MPWLVLGIAVVIGLILIGRGLYGLDPKRARKVVLWIMLIVAGIGGIVALARAGSLLWALGFVVLPLLMRWRTLINYLRNLKGPSPGAATGVETRFLRMNLDHDSGILDGMVLEAPWDG